MVRRSVVFRHEAAHRGDVRIHIIRGFRARAAGKVALEVRAARNAAEDNTPQVRAEPLDFRLHVAPFHLLLTVEQEAAAPLLAQPHMPNACRAHEADRIRDHIGENGGDARFVAPCQRRFVEDIRTRHAPRRTVGCLILPRFRQGDVSCFLRVNGRFCQRLRQQKAQYQQYRGDSLHPLHPRYFLIVVTPSSQRKYTVSGSSVTPSLANSSSTVSRMYPCS